MAWIRFRHSMYGVLVGRLQSVCTEMNSGEPYVFSDECRLADTGARAPFERTGVKLSAVIGVERDRALPRARAR